MDIVLKYIIALTNFYGVATPQIVVAVYNQQNDDPISEDSIHQYIIKPPKELAEHYVFVEGGLFVHDSLFVGNDTLINLIEEKNNKPYYIPERRELKKYLDANYIEKNEHYYRLYRYLRKQFGDMSDDLIEEICNNFVFALKDGELNFGFIIQQLRSFGISLEDSQDFQQNVKLIADLGLNVRLWENNGFTRKEFFEQEVSSLLHYEVYEQHSSEKSYSSGEMTSKEKIRHLDDYRC